ncbi:MAG TPA: TetR/AcrR family transcriptional regulator [Flavisolibacter sp.]|nr:TetR/AcrR family transcriptional regulator [Flavisolibacter sp.]
MGVKERRERQREEVRSNILATAWQMVKEEGWQSLSMRKLADAIEYSAPVIYDHFENKEAILEEFAKEGFRLLSKKIQQAKGKHDEPADQLKAVADAYWNFAFRNREHYQLMYGLGMPGCEIEKCFPERAGFRDSVLEPIVAILSKGGNPGANPCLKYYTFWSILHGLISIKSMSANVSDEVNKLVLEDAVTGFIKNLN